MIEVETKIPIKDIKEVKDKVSKEFKYIKKEEKIDDYYAEIPRESRTSQKRAPSNHTFKDVMAHRFSDSLEDLKKYPEKSLRIRKKEGVHIVNFKRRVSYKDGIHAKKEVEFVVSDIVGFIKLIKDFGFQKWLRKEKITHLYEIKKNFHIELNEVKGLGWFFEIEYLVKDKKNIVKARNEISKVLREFGFNKSEIVRSGYTKLLWDKEKKN